MSAGHGCSTGIPVRGVTSRASSTPAASPTRSSRSGWTETMPAQPEIEAYLNFVADRLDLRRDISFNTEVVGMTFDEDAGEWLVETWAGECFVAPFVVAASGILSVPLEPEIPGMDTFAGPSLYTSCWPKEGVDLTGKRVGVIGTGSTGVQLIPVVARQAGHLSVFQRSPAYTLPWQVRPFEPGELDEMKSRYCPTPSVSGSSTRPRWSRRPCSSTRPATPGTTGAMFPARNGCTWAIRRAFRNTVAGAMRSQPPDTRASSSPSR